MKTMRRMAALLALAAVFMAAAVMAQSNGTPETNAVLANAPAAGVTLTADQMEKLDNSVTALLPLIPSKYQGLVAGAILLLALASKLGRAVVGYRAGGWWGALKAVFAGSVTAVKAVALIGVIGLTGLMVTGCNTTMDKVASSPAPKHVVHIMANLNKDGIGYSTTTGGASLGVEEGYATLTTIPILYVQQTNGLWACVYPDVTESFEVAGKSFLFGAAGTTHTLATGRGVYTQVGGAHQPINEGFYGTNNMMTYGQLVGSSNAAVPVKTTTVTTGTGSNAVTTVTSEPMPSVNVPGF